MYLGTDASGFVFRIIMTRVPYIIQMGYIIALRLMEMVTKSPNQRLRTKNGALHSTIYHSCAAILYNKSVIIRSDFLTKSHNNTNQLPVKLP